MVRDFNIEYFTNCKSYLSKQISEMSTMKQGLSSALSKEYSSEFADGYLKNKYNEISSLLSQETQNNIEWQITCGKKSVGIYNIDSKYAQELKTCSESFVPTKESLKEMSDSITSSTSNFNQVSPDANLLINVLPKDRAAEIKNGRLFISADGQYLYYNGYQYKVYDPNAAKSDGPCFSPVYEWTIDEVKTISSNDTDVWAGINGFFNSNGVSNLDQDASAAFNAPMLLLGILEGIAAGRTTTTIEATFRTNQFGEREVIIGLKDSSIQNSFNNWDYSKPSSIYDGCSNVSNYMASQAAESAYEVITGNVASDNISTQYDVHITLDEAHQYSDYPHYIISFNSDGKALMTPNYFPGDKMEVTEFTNFMSFRKGETTVWESSLSDYFEPVELSNPELLLNCLMSD